MPTSTEQSKVIIPPPRSTGPIMDLSWVLIIFVLIVLMIVESRGLSMDCDCGEVKVVLWHSSL